MTLTALEIFTSVRDELLGEAQRSPGLLADLANLERYVAETYSARSFIELLQNADDAEATRFLLTRQDEWLICANNGREFSRQDFFSLCRSASSAKQRGQTIGYRGIGFKSVVGVATSVHLVSGELRATFSRDLTQSCLASHTPTPLVRIPHPLALGQDEHVLAVVQQLEQSGYTTIFVLGGLDAERVQDEYDQFDADYLLFLRHISEAKLTGLEKRSYQCKRSSLNTNTRDVTIIGPDRHSAWRIQQFSQCDIAFSLVDNKPIPLNPDAAIVHAFLPTLEGTGFGIRVNADFSTDPSRTRITFDDATFACIDDAAQAVADKIYEAAISPECDSNLLACLTPTMDLATIALQKRSFRTELVSRVKKRLEHLKEKVTLAPAWLNSLDVQLLATSLNRVILAPTGCQSEAQKNFMRYLGVGTLSAESVLKVVEVVQISSKGCAELLAHCMRNVASGATFRRLSEMPIWVGQGSLAPASLKALLDKRVSIDSGMIDTINAAGVTSTDLARMFKSVGLDDKAISIILPGAGGVIPDNMPAPACGLSSSFLGKEGSSSQKLFDPLLPGTAPQAVGGRPTAPITGRSLPAWRGAEQYVAMVLEEFDYRVEDRSRQNLGYDLYVEKEGRKYYIEVKLLDYAGQPFIITTNEETVARECGDAYIVALTLRSSDDGVHVQFIHDPTRTLKFVRQCRQWVWECSDYEFKPQSQTYT